MRTDFNQERQIVFQSTRPRGARPVGGCSGHCMAEVSIHAPARGATRRHATVRRYGIDVSIHAPARGATFSNSPRLFASHVSIHAPARGATRYRHKSPRFAVQFQSTRPRGARLEDERDLRQVFSFNPRAREGRDSIEGAEDSPVKLFQSTRPRGARRVWAEWPQDASFRFNPRAREGRDFFALPSIRIKTSFNPRAREGRDSRRMPTACLQRSFNPRAREGRDRLPRLHHVADVRVSIHAPERGATGPVRRDDLMVRVSIHAPVRGATAQGVPIVWQVEAFQSTRPRGARP